MPRTSLCPALLLLALGLPSLAVGIPLKAPLRVPSGGPHPENWFEHSTLDQREELRELGSSRVTRAQQLIPLLMQGDEEAYCELAVRSLENREIVNTLYSKANREQRAILAPLRAYHRLCPKKLPIWNTQRPEEPRAHVILLLRDAHLQKKQAARRDALYRIMQHEANLNKVEIEFISSALEQWCGLSAEDMAQQRLARQFILSFAPGRPVQLNRATRDSRPGSRLYHFAVAEAGINNERIYRNEDPTEIMWRCLWRYPDVSIRLAEAQNRHELSLLRMNADGLTRYTNSLEAGGRKAPAPLPQADEAPAAAQQLIRVRRLLAEGRREEAEALVSALEATPATDTTPACRTARSLLVAESQPALAERLRRDALLLALAHYNIDPQTLYAYADDLLAHGSAEELALVQRLSLWCRALPFSRAMAERYAALGCHEQAAFCCEALLALAPHAATPPDEAQLAALRQLQQSNRAHGQQAATAGTAPAKALPLASPFRAESRSWKLRDGSSVEGTLAAIYPTLSEIALRREDGTVLHLSMESLADDPTPLFEQWRADNGIRDWKWGQGNGCYHGTARGRLLSCYPDLGHPGHFHYLVINENLSVMREQSWGLGEEDRRLIAKHYREHGSARPCGDPLVAANLAEARRLSEEKGVPVMLYFAAGLPPASPTTGNDIVVLEHHLTEHPEAAAQWRDSMVILPIFLSTKNGYPATYDDEQLEELRAWERELRPGTTTASSLITEAVAPDGPIRSNSCWVCLEHGIISENTLPPKLPVSSAPPLAPRLP